MKVDQRISCGLMLVLALWVVALGFGGFAAAPGPAITGPKVLQAVAGPDAFGGFASDHIVVRVKPGVSAIKRADGRWTFLVAGTAQSSSVIAAATQRRGVTSIKATMRPAPKNIALAQQLGLDRYFTISVPRGSDAPGMVAEFAAFSDMIESAQLDGIGGIAATIPNDTDFAAQQWNMNNTGQFGGTVHADIDATEAWDITQGNNIVVLAILDTGIQHFDSSVAGSTDHPDLPGSRILPGWSTYSNTANTDDQHGHGTHVAGIAAARGNDNTGVAGVNWNVKILPVQCVNPVTGSGSETQCGDAIMWATDHGANIISMSLQFYTGNTYLRDMVAYAYDNGVLPIAATGNFHPAGEIAFPAKWPKCMAVGATNRFDAIYSGSNSGPEIDVSAPGELVYSCWRGSGYSIQSGTSMATPHVSGLATLIKTVNPGLMPAQIEDILKSTADDRGPAGFDQQFGFGRINAYHALLAALPPIPGDVNGDHHVNVDDLLSVINAWGICPNPNSCPADVTHNGMVDVDDLLVVIYNWTN